MDTTAQHTRQARSGGAPAPTVWPTLKANDAPALIDFLVDVFGFEPTVVYRDGDTVAHAQLDWPEGGGVMLGSYESESEWRLPPGSFGAYVVTSEVDALYDRVRASGARITREPTDRDFGSREFHAQDPEGNLWSFGTYRGEPPA